MKKTQKKLELNKTNITVFSQEKIKLIRGGNSGVDDTNTSISYEDSYITNKE